MILTRCAPKIAKCLWTSFNPHYTSVTSVCRTISTGVDQQRYGVRGGDASSRFLGKWHEIDSESLEEFLHRFGVKPSGIETFARERKWISYRKDGNDWLCSTGGYHSDVCHQLTFQMNRRFCTEIIIGVPVQINIEMTGATMTETQDYLFQPRTTVRIHRSVVKDDEMIAEYMIDEVKMKRLFALEPRK